jgi:hypothetical protein
LNYFHRSKNYKTSKKATQSEYKDDKMSVALNNTYITGESFKLEEATNEPNMIREKSNQVISGIEKLKYIQTFPISFYLNQ